MRRSKFEAQAAVTLCFLVCALTVLSDDSPRKAAVTSKPPTAASPVANTRESHSVVLRANAIAGMSVMSPSDQDLGKVEDVVIDMETGSVRYAAIAFGGTLGVGDKLFAVPFQALRVKHNPGDKKTHFVLNIDKKTLEKAKGFDKKNWPDFADPRFAQENDVY